jgi:hypothetical protein
VKWVLATVNKYITPFVTPPLDEADEVLSESYHDDDDAGEDGDQNYEKLAAKISIEKSGGKVGLHNALIDDSSWGNSRTMSDMPSNVPSNKMDLRRSYSEGNNPLTLQGEEFEKFQPRTLRESGSLYSFVNFSPKVTRRSRENSRQNSRQTSKAPRVVSTVIEETSSHLHSASAGEEDASRPNIGFTAL